MTMGSPGPEQPEAQRPSAPAPRWPPAPMPTYPPPPAAPPGYATPYSSTSTNGFAVASLVLGIVGPVLCVAWILALVFGYLGRSQIAASGGRQTGRGLATAGIVLGWVWGALILLYVVIVVIASASSNS